VPAALGREEIMTKEQFQRRLSDLTKQYQLERGTYDASWWMADRLRDLANRIERDINDAMSRREP